MQHPPFVAQVRERIEELAPQFSRFSVAPTSSEERVAAHRAVSETIRDVAPSIGLLSEQVVDAVAVAALALDARQRIEGDVPHHVAMVHDLLDAFAPTRTVRPHDALQRAVDSTIGRSARLHMPQPFPEPLRWLRVHLLKEAKVAAAAPGATIPAPTLLAAVGAVWERTTAQGALRGHIRAVRQLARAEGRQALAPATIARALELDQPTAAPMAHQVAEGNLQWLQRTMATHFGQDDAHRALLVLLAAVHLKSDASPPGSSRRTHVVRQDILAPFAKGDLAGAADALVAAVAEAPWHFPPATIEQWAHPTPEGPTSTPPAPKPRARRRSQGEVLRDVRLMLRQNYGQVWLDVEKRELVSVKLPEPHERAARMCRRAVAPQLVVGPGGRATCVPYQEPVLSMRPIGLVDVAKQLATMMPLLPRRTAPGERGPKAPPWTEIDASQQRLVVAALEDLGLRNHEAELALLSAHKEQLQQAIAAVADPRAVQARQAAWERAAARGVRRPGGPARPANPATSPLESLPRGIVTSRAKAAPTEPSDLPAWMNRGRSAVAIAWPDATGKEQLGLVVQLDAAPVTIRSARRIGRSGSRSWLIWDQPRPVDIAALDRALSTGEVTAVATIERRKLVDLHVTDGAIVCATRALPGWRQRFAHLPSNVLYGTLVEHVHHSGAQRKGGRLPSI